MKVLMTMAAVGVMAVGTLACPGGDCTGDQAKTTKVSAQAKADCASACKSAKGAQVVNAAAKADCASACKSAKGAQVVNAAAKADCASACKTAKGAQVVNAAAKADCASACKSAKGAQVVNAAAKADCASACKSAKGAQVVNAADSADCASACKAQKAAMVAKAKALGMPVMTFAVGDQSTCCPLEAHAMAMEAGTMPVATLNGKTYDNPMAGLDAWESALSDKLASMTRVSYVVNGTETQCSKTAGKMAAECGKGMITRVANKEFACNKTAHKTALKAVQAADAVPFVMTVAGTEYHCTQTAADASRLSGEPVIYTVNGAETQCQKTAQCILLASRIMATADALEVKTDAEPDA